jgi:hypothetical protein
MIDVMIRRLVRSRSMVAVGHYALWPCVLLALGMRITVVTWGYAACYTIGAAMVPLLLALVAHGGGICTRGSCGVLISAVPTDEVKRRRWWLRHAHCRPLNGVVVILLASWFVLTFIIVNPILSSIPVIALFYVELRAIQLHSRLRPWCPWCRGGGGEGGADSMGQGPDDGLHQPIPLSKGGSHAY